MCASKFVAGKNSASARGEKSQEDTTCAVSCSRGRLQQVPRIQIQPEACICTAHCQENTQTRMEWSKYKVEIHCTLRTINSTLGCNYFKPQKLQQTELCPATHFGCNEVSNCRSGKESLLTYISVFKKTH